MSELVHADIFFFITAVAVVALAIEMAIALYFLIGILKDAREIMRKARSAAGDLERDFQDARAAVRAEGVRFKTLADVVVGFFTKRFTPARRKKKQADSSQEV